MANATKSNERKTALSIVILTAGCMWMLVSIPMSLLDLSLGWYAAYVGAPALVLLTLVVKALRRASLAQATD